MSKFLQAWLALALVLAFVAKSSPQSASAASGGTIVGTVYASGSAKPIANARVTAVSPSSRYATVTDANGQFKIPGVELETYSISVEAPGYEPYSRAGVTVTADEVVRLDTSLSTTTRTIARVTARITNAFQPTQVVDRYTYDAAGISQLLGKTFETNGTKLLSELPGVTVDKTGTPLIRGGFNFETSYQVEGIDYTEPSQNLSDRFANVANGYLLNGVGSLEIIPGAGDATHGNTGTGLIAIAIKRGTYPAKVGIDYETGLLGGDKQIAAEYGFASPDGHLANYFSAIASTRNFQYGPYGTDPASIGGSPLAFDPSTTGSFSRARTSLFQTSLLDPQELRTTDIIDNLVFRFGKNNANALQFFFQNLDVRQRLDYGGYQNLKTPDPFALGIISSQINDPFAGLQDPSLTFARQALIPQNPVGPPGTVLTGPETTYSPLQAFKFEYDRNFASSALGVRYFRTFSDQKQALPSLGIEAPSNGGTRTGASIDFTASLGLKHNLQVGGKYEFVRPFGSFADNLDYLAAFTGTGLTDFIGRIDLLPDFVRPQAPVPLAGDTSGTAFVSGTPGCRPFLPQSTAVCGYLPNALGGTRSLPGEREIPTALQQSYGLYLQDTYSPNAKLKVLAGLRLDGYNFLLPSDPQDPPAVNGIRQQRTYEPKVGIAYRFGNRDAVRANFGRSLSVPLATFLGKNVDRSQFAAYEKVASYDNRTGQAATYCGPVAVTQPTPGSTALTLGPGRTCTNYADQLYWLQRDYRFGLQSQINYPLRGATFTNFDFSYSHLFADGTGLKLTPFYRRGYDVVESTRSLLGFDLNTGIEQLSPEAYSNLGVQRATGVEFVVTKQRPYGLSGQLSATYINQIGNDPSSSYLPTASLQLGELYRSPNLSPFQSTLALTYRSRGGFRINPIFTYKSGYPFGSGNLQGFTLGGRAYYIPFTDAIFSQNLFNQVCSYADPVNPGLVTAPNIAAICSGESRTSGPGSYRSKATINTDLTIELSPPTSHLTFGIGITNLFDQTADLPIKNLALTCAQAFTGLCVANPNAATKPLGTIGSGSQQPYIVFGNQEPIKIRAYIQVAN